jgi:hypothetical protein
VLTCMTFWMRNHARSISAELRFDFRLGIWTAFANARTKAARLLPRSPSQYPGRDQQRGQRAGKPYRLHDEGLGVLVVSEVHGGPDTVAPGGRKRPMKA